VDDVALCGTDAGVPNKSCTVVCHHFYTGRTVCNGTCGP
jgi:hypothetical protein